MTHCSKSLIHLKVLSGYTMTNNFTKNENQVCNKVAIVNYLVDNIK